MCSVLRSPFDKELKDLIYIQIFIQFSIQNSVVLCSDFSYESETSNSNEVRYKIATALCRLKFCTARCKIYKLIIRHVFR